MEIKVAAPSPTAEVVIKAAPSLARQKQTILTLADRFEGQIRARFVRAINELTSQAKLRALAERLAVNDVDGALKLLGIEQVGAAMGATADSINTAYAAAGVSTVRQAADGTLGAKFFVRFDQVNPRAVAYAQRSNYQLIHGLTQELRENVRVVISEGTAAGLNPNVVAREIREVVGLDPRRAQALRNFRRALEQRSRRALGYDVGGTAERVINAAYRDSTLSASKINDLVEGYRQRLLNQRARTIARTEAMRAASNGQHEAYKQIFDHHPGIDRNKVRRYWVSTNDPRTRDSHREMPLLNQDGVGLDQPFVLPDDKGAIMFPHDPDAPASETINCRCTVVIRFNEIPESQLPPVLAGRSILPTNTKKVFDPNQPRDESGKWSETGGPSVDDLIAQASKLVANSNSDTLQNLAYPLRRSDEALEVIHRVASRSNLKSAARILDSGTKWQGNWIESHEEWLAAQTLGGNGSMSRSTKSSLKDRQNNEGSFRYGREWTPLSETDMEAFKARREWMQEKFRAEYGEEVEIYRGVDSKLAKKLPNSGEVDLPGYSLSSWTTDPSVAREFARKSGKVLKTKIKAKDVWMLPRRGVQGVIRVADASSEIVILNEGTTRKAEIL